MKIRLSRVRAATFEEERVPWHSGAEVTLTPVGTATVTITAIPQKNDGTAGAPIVQPFTCKG